MENIKKYKLTFILALVFLALAVFYISLPSKEVIKDIEVKKTEKISRTIDINAYFVDSDVVKAYTFTTNEDTYSNLLKAAVIDIINKYSKNNMKIKLLNIYFSDNSVYFEFNEKKLDSLLKEAIIKTTTELLEITDIKFI